MILTNCRLIPELCEGFQEERADIRVEGNTIAEILPAGGRYTGEQVAPPPLYSNLHEVPLNDARLEQTNIIDCAGMTVLPGLFNIHCHLFFNAMGADTPPFPLQSEYMHLSNSYRYMQRLLAYGYTSLRDVGTPWNCAIKLRDSINAGEIVGPDIKACGNILVPDQVAPPLPYSNLYGMPLNDPYLVRAAVRKTVQDGADFIKILGCSVKGDWAKRGTGSLLYPDEMDELVNAVNREGVYLAVHTDNEASNTLANEYEVYSIEHGHKWSQKNMDEYIAHGRKSAFVPTLTICSPWGGEEAVQIKCSGLRMAYDDGALMGWGTDAPQPLFMQEPGMEFRLREKILGLPKIEILKQATINSAKINQTDGERGSIKVGKRADFAIFDGNPDEDFGLFNLPPAYVIKDGQVVAREGFVKM